MNLEGKNMPDVEPTIEVTPVVETPTNVFDLTTITPDFNIETLPKELKAIIDRERTKASKTARDKAIDDPELLSKARTAVEKEVTLTTEEKLQGMLDSVMLRENRVDAKSVLSDLGLSSEEMDGALELFVDKDKEATIARVTGYKGLLTAMVASQVEKKIKDSVDNTPKPKTNAPLTDKAFKDMSYEERRALREKNPTRFEKEMKAMKPRI